jgi:hypothetical protein
MRDRRFVMGGAAANGAHALVLLFGALIAAVVFGRFAWRHFDEVASPGQRVGALVALLGLSGLVVVIGLAAINSS